MPTPNFQNHTLFHGDNLLFLRDTNPETIDLIATDPPCNKEKKDLLTLSGFQDVNRKDGHLTGDREPNIKRGRATRRGRKRR